MRALSHWPALVVSIALTGWVLWLHQDIVARAGEFSYCLDDAYIHLAIAKNLANHFVWGVTKYEFASASSSPLWVLLLAAAMFVSKVHLYFPLALNLLIAPAALFVAGAALRRRGLPAPLILLVLAAIVYCAAWPTLIIGGMEHSLHILLVFLWIAILDQALREDSALTRGTVLRLAAVAGAICICRYESLFLVFVTCLVLLARRDLLAAMTIGVAAWIPAGLFGLYAMSRGWHVLPNSVLVKGSEFHRDWKTPEHVFDALFGHSLSQAIENPHMFVPLVAATVLLWWLGREQAALLRSPRALIVVYLGTLFLHLQWARLGWFYRYEGYLLASGVLVMALALAERAGQARPRWVMATGLAAMCLLLTPRTVVASDLTPEAAKNIHDQQMQIGHFLAEEMNTDTVALNDIGAASLFSRVHVVDYYGLGTIDTANWRMTHSGYTAEAVQEIARRHHVQLAIVHRPWLGPAIPPSWKFIGSWTAPPPNVLLGDQTVSFFAVDRTPAEAIELVRRLVEYSQKLPEKTDIRIPGELMAALRGR